MPEREMVTVRKRGKTKTMKKTSDIKCPNCGKTVPENAIAQDGCCGEACYSQRLKRIQRLFKEEERRICRGACEDEGFNLRRFAEETVKRVHGYDVHIPVNDPDPWWYVVG